MSDILFKTDDYVFSYRVGGLLIHNSKVLMQKLVGDDGYAFIGGHVAFGETTAETIVREFKEEIGADINVERLFMVNENFFPWGNRPCQQINLYYLIALKDEKQIPLEDIPSKNIYPPQAKEYIVNIPAEVVHFVYKE